MIMEAVLAHQVPEVVLRIPPCGRGHEPPANVDPDVLAVGCCQDIELQVVGLVTGTDARNQSSCTITPQTTPGAETEC